MLWKCGILGVLIPVQRILLLSCIGEEDDIQVNLPVLSHRVLRESHRRREMGVRKRNGENFLGELLPEARSDRVAKELGRPVPSATLHPIHGGFPE